MPLALDQKVGAVVWSPLGWGRLTGKIRRGQPLPESSRLQSKLVADVGPQVPDEYSYRVVDALDEVAKETGKTVPQVALNWLLQRPDGRQRDRRRAQRGAAAAEPRRGRLEAHAPSRWRRSTPPAPRTLAYPYWHQAGFAERNPPPVLNTQRLCYGPLSNCHSPAPLVFGSRGSGVTTWLLTQCSPSIRARAHARGSQRLSSLVPAHNVLRYPLRGGRPVARPFANCTRGARERAERDGDYAGCTIAPLTWVIALWRYASGAQSRGPLMVSSWFLAE